MNYVEDIKNRIAGYKTETVELDQKSAQLKKDIEREKQSLNANDEKHKEFDSKIESANAGIQEKKSEEEKALELVSKYSVDFANIEQAVSYTKENINRVDSEIERLKGDRERIKTGALESENELKVKKEQAADLKNFIEDNKEKAAKLLEQIEDQTREG